MSRRTRQAPPHELPRPKMTMREAILKLVEREEQSADQALRDFALRLAADPCDALANVDDAHEAASAKRALQRVRTHIEGVTLDDFWERLQDDLLHYARFVPRSTSVYRNMLERNELSMLARVSLHVDRIMRSPNSYLPETP